MNSTSTSSYEHDVPVKYIRTLDARLLPPRVGHNWLDAAFRSVQGKPQQLEEEFRGKRAFMPPGVYDHTPPEGLGLTARQLMQALSTRRKDGPAPDGRPIFTTLSDKVLRFYAFFSEKAPEGCCEEYWHRCVVINFYPEDDTVLIQEPPIPNSGLPGGTFLKRQKVRADPRQREQFPSDEFLTINHFNVGYSVRINCVEFFLYDCDAFTRDFLTEIGVDVGEPMQYPDSSFMSQWKHQQEQRATTNYGIVSNNYYRDDAVRAARFVLDAGKVLRFYGLLDERDKTTGGAVRKLEVLYFVEDDSIAVVERPTTNEAVPALFLSRGWLPKAGSIEKTLEFTFAHRVNGMREPYVGPGGCYTARDLGVGATINVLGRGVFLYDCDDFTRSYYKETFGVELAEAIDGLSQYGLPSKPDVVSFRSNATPASAPATVAPKVVETNVIIKKGDVLRFLLRLSAPCTSAERMRRFTLTHYTATGDSMVYESPIKNSGYVGGCFSSRSRIPNPAGGPGAYYTHEDFKVGSIIVINAHKFEVMNMDEHTANFLACKGETALNEEQLRLLVDAFRLFLRTRFHSFRDAFLGFDRDKDSVISVTEFVDHVTHLQITDRRMDAQALFDSICQNPETGYLTLETFVDWINQKGSESCGDAKSSQPINIDERALMRKALCQLCERLEARCLNSLQMFRLASTMPRAYSGRRADCYSLTNPHRDAYITPVQLRRCIEEVLGGNPSPRELDALLFFFFPALPPEEYRVKRDISLEHSLDLKAFQKKYHEMCTLQQLS
ncbi:Repeat of unknown function (DUF1126), putative [Trypanosoma equiperdum]|uniref:EF-hand domain-containing family member C2 n=2 Tax=Trypanozoon TaxID=39700 RepID=Q57ZX1_TRYB2|nr:hypothetical protein, conserved [Trypanosoma brucei brucei TREU927]AAX79354.1 hypothetical protein, conserved [Trypanosoma brucei]AAZ11408.1 hypothetical protein, conserved [Trypanosoma brucei brucei TREU927]SCU65080.1 Repeat of unknown function (DUF1126), putative [Trypanosoma equiperdum]